jgi:hypothetical protein
MAPPMGCEAAGRRPWNFPLVKASARSLEVGAGGGGGAATAAAARGGCGTRCAALMARFAEADAPRLAKWLLVVAVRFLTDCGDAPSDIKLDACSLEVEGTIREAPLLASHCGVGVAAAAGKRTVAAGDDEIG